MVRFTRYRRTLRATTVAFERQPVFEKTIGTNVLAMTPRAFQRSLLRAYGSRFAIATPRHCDQGVCSVTFRNSDSARRVTFGTTKLLGAFLTMWLAR